jgi:putative transposase
VDLNPVRAGIVSEAEAYRWTSARAHVTAQDPSQPLDMASWSPICDAADWKQLLAREEDRAELGRLRHATRTGRPCGDVAFVEQIERRLGRRLQPRVGGRPVRGAATPDGDSQASASPQGDSHQVFPLPARPKETQFDNKAW